nr:S-protein homolog 5-like [Ipomoea batatas]
MMSRRKRITSKLFVCFLAILSVASPATASLWKMPLAGVIIFNRLPYTSSDELKVHCRSKDNDLGLQKIPKGTDYSWRFSLHLLGRTLYFCSFDWGSKHMVFDVYTEPFAKFNCRNTGAFGCAWIVRKDGFYLSNGLKMHSW